jgi:hypothetical protein
MRYFLFAAAAAIACLGCDESTTNSTKKSQAVSPVGTTINSAVRRDGITAAGAPVAKFKIKPPSGDKTTNFSFDGSKSEGAITSYTWDFGDGNNGTGATVQHKFQDNGNYKVRLTVSDGQNSDFRKKTLDVGNGGGGGGGGGETKCVYTNPPRHVWFFKVISQDRASKTIIAQFEQNVGCDDVFYLCGDVRIGGTKPGEKEYWIGTICEMWSQGNNRFRIRLVDGRYWVDTGETGTYVWPQYDCNPHVACSAFGY